MIKGSKCFMMLITEFISQYLKSLYNVYIVDVIEKRNQNHDKYS